MPSRSLSLRDRCREGPGPGGKMPAPAGTAGGGARAGDDMAATPRYQARTHITLHLCSPLLTPAATHQKQRKRIKAKRKQRKIININKHGKGTLLAVANET